MLSPLDVHVELLVGTTTPWVDITHDVRGAPSRGGINGTRGTAPEGQRPSPSSYTMLINNRNGDYSPRNPIGQYYGDIGRNTSIRIFVDFPAPSFRSASTATPGDVEEFTVTAPAGMAAGDALYAFQGFATYPLESDLRTPQGGARWQLLQVVNDSTGDLVQGALWWKIALFNEPASYTFYNPDGGEGVVSIAAVEDAVYDPYTFGSIDTDRELAATTAVTTPSIAPVGNVDLELRWAGGLPVGAGVTWTPPAGVTERADINSANAVTGTLGSRNLSTIATTTALNFTASGNVTDGYGFTVSVPSRSYRFFGEVSEWPPRSDCSDGNLWVPITASGPLRRLNQGGEAVSSMRALYEQRKRFSPPELWAYWPLEDGNEALAPASIFLGHAPMVVTGDIQFAASDRLAGSASTPVFESATRLRGTVLGADSGDVHASALYAFQGNQPDNGAILMEIRGSGTIATWRVIYGTGFILSLVAYDDDGVQVDTTGTFDFSASLSLNGRFLLKVAMTQAGADVTVSFNVANISNDYVVTQAGVGDTFSGQTVGTPGSILVGPGLTNVTVGHIGIGAFLGVANATDEAIIGYFGEQAASRISRLLTGTGVDMIAEMGSNVVPESATILDNTHTVAMGEEPIATIMDKITEAVESDRGVLYEDRARLRLIYKSFNALVNQSPTAPLDYGDLAAPLDPTEDDLLLANDITVSQRSGSDARVVKETGPLSIELPPDGVGTYTRSATVNVASDLELPNIANWLLRLGTWDDLRFESIDIRNLAILDCPLNPILTRFAAALDPGDVISIDGLPDWLPPDLIRALVRGGGERLDTYQWLLGFNAVPAGPYDVGIFAAIGGDAPAGGDPEPDAPMRFSSQGSETTSVFAAGTGTSLSVTTTLGPLWTQNQNGDFDIRVSGVRLRVTAIGAPAGQVQVFTVDQAPINGVVKSIPAGSPVELWTPAVFSL